MWLSASGQSGCALPPLHPKRQIFALPLPPTFLTRTCPQPGPAVLSCAEFWNPVLGNPLWLHI